MQQYKEFKKGQNKLKRVSAVLDEEAGESLQSLVEMLEQFKLPIQLLRKKKRDEELYNWFVSQKQYFLVAFISLCLGLSVMQLFADFVQGYNSRWSNWSIRSDKTCNSLSKSRWFWQYQDVANFTNRMPADRAGESLNHVVEIQQKLANL